MALSTYYDPKSSSYVSTWNAKKKDSQDADDWLAENMPWHASSKDRRDQSGFRLRQGPTNEQLHETGGPQSAAETGDWLFTQKQIGDSDVTRIALDKDRERYTPANSEEEQAHLDAYAEYQLAQSKEALGAGSVLGIAGQMAQVAMPDNVVGYAEDQIAEEEAERVDRMQADAARLTQEASVANQRLGGPGATQDPLVANYGQQAPAGHDEWFRSLFG